MFRFADPAALLMLTILPVIAASWFWVRKPTLSAGYSLLDRLASIPGAISHRPIWIPRCLRVIAITLLILAAARPQSGEKKEIITSEGVDIVVALDISGSMRALDFQPDNRLEVAKQVIGDFIDGRSHDRIGLVLFGSEAFTLCPLTLDHGLLKEFLAQARIGMVEEQTAVGKAVSSAVNRLRVTGETRGRPDRRASASETEAARGVIILVTDGVNNVQSGMDPITAAKAAESLGITIYTIGVGTNGMAPFPDPRFRGRVVSAPVELDEDTLKEIAAITGGQYFPARNAAALETIFSVIDSMETVAIESYQYTRYSELMAWFLLPGLLVLLMDQVVRHTVYRRFPW